MSFGITQYVFAYLLKTAARIFLIVGSYKYFHFVTVAGDLTGRENNKRWNFYQPGLGPTGNPIINRNSILCENILTGCESFYFGQLE